MWVAADKWGTRIVQLVVMAALARFLSASDFGLVALAMTLIALSNAFANQGFNSALVQRASLDAEHKNVAFWTSLALATVLCGALAALAGPLAALLGEPRLAEVTRWLALSLPLLALSAVPEALLQRTFDFQVIALRRVVGAVVGGIAGVAFALAGAGVDALIIHNLTTVAVGTAVLWLATSWRPGLAMSRRHFRDLWSFGIHVTGIELLAFVNAQGDRFIVGAIAGPTALGFYFIGVRVYSLVSEAITTVMGTLALPTFARLQHEPERLRNAFYTATRTSTTIAAPVFGGLLVLAPELVPLLFGEGWTDSIPVLQVLCGLGLVVSAAFFDRGALLAVGRQKAALALTGGQAVLNVVIALLTVPFGILAVASGVTARQYAYWPVRLWVMRRAIGLDIARYMWQWGRPVLATAAMVAVMLVVRQLVGDLGALPTILISGATGLGAYVLVMWSFARSSLLEVVDLLRLR